MEKPKVILVVLDGWGYREEAGYNGIAEAETPYFDYLWDHLPHSLLEASGESVGLPEGQMGNSEVGHTTIGAGKAINTDFVKISKAIKTGEFEKNPAIMELFDHVKNYDSILHLQGLLGPGGVHSHSEHLYALLRAAKKAGLTKVAIHIFTDGRDTPPQSAGSYLAELEKVVTEIGVGFIATASGRFYAMDRDNNWDRLQKAEAAIFHGKGRTCKEQASEIINNLYLENILDEHMEPIVFLDETQKSYQISQNDGVFFFNFRSDRAKMLTQKLLEMKTKQNVCLVTMTQYDKYFDCLTAFMPEEIETTLAKEIAKAGLSQIHIAETEKFAHATYFLNGGQTEPHEGESHRMIESRKDIKTHDQAPEMRAKEIANETILAIENNYNFIFVNFANADMVGHTANKDALLKALGTVDNELRRIIEEAQTCNYHLLITADHGNAEIYFDVISKTNHTAHTTSPVPCILVSPNNRLKLRDGGLYDIAPTILKLLRIPKPISMTGNSLLQNKKCP